jgi:hypothetical protein
MSGIKSIELYWWLTDYHRMRASVLYLLHAQALLDNSHKSGADYQQMADWTEQMQQLAAEADAKTERWMELAELL